jgi:prepilin-type processing-associated H-X9-DG protein
MLCPSSPCPISEKWNDVTADHTIGTTAGDGTLEDPPDPVTVDEAGEIYLAGYNTNYASSWYMVRTEMRYGLLHPDTYEYYQNEEGYDLAGADGLWGTDDDDLCLAWYEAPIAEHAANGGADDGSGACTNSWHEGNGKGVDSTVGPLSKATLDNLRGVSASRIPLLGDSNWGSFSEAALAYELPGIAKQTLACESFCDGPIAFNPNFLEKDTDDDGAYNWVLGQDYVDFAPYHGGGTSRKANILFADGHVDSIVDKDGDKFIGYTGATEDADGNPIATDDTITDDHKALLGDPSELDKIHYGALQAPRSGSL